MVSILLGRSYSTSLPLDTWELLHQNFGEASGTSAKEPTCQYRRQEMWALSLGREDPLQEEMATQSSILAWEIHGQRSLMGYRVKSMGAGGGGHRVRHN